MKKRTLALLMAALMVLGLLSACGGAAPDAAAAPASEAAPAEEAAEPEAAAPAREIETADASAAEGSAAEEAEEPEEKGEFVAAPAELPVAEGARFSYFVELPGYMSMFNVNSYSDVPAEKIIIRPFYDSRSERKMTHEEFEKELKAFFDNKFQFGPEVKEKGI